MVGQAGTRNEQEIEITSEMIEAGAEIILENAEYNKTVIWAKDLAEAILRSALATAQGHDKF